MQLGDVPVAGYASLRLCQFGVMPILGYVSSGLCQLTDVSVEYVKQSDFLGTILILSSYFKRRIFFFITNVKNHSLSTIFL